MDMAIEAARAVPRRYSPGTSWNLGANRFRVREVWYGPDGKLRITFEQEEPKPKS